VTYAAEAPAPRRLGRPAPRDATSAWPLWLSSGLTPERLASITRQADLGYLTYQLALLQEITGKDGLIQGLLVQRLSALSQRRVVCEPSPADHDAGRAKEVAAYCQQILDGLRLTEPDEGDGYRDLGGLPAVVEQLDKASYFGVELSWVHWGVRPGEPLPVPRYLEPLDERRYSCDVYSQTLHLGSGYALGVPVTAYDPALYVEVRANRLSRTLSQSGSGRAILIPWSLRFGTLKDLISYLQLWGLPSVIGTMDAAVSAGFDESQLARYQQYLDDIAGDSRAVLPPGFEVSVINAVTGGEKIHELLDSLTERHIQFAIVGQTGTSAANNTNRASAEVSERVFDNLIEGDARMVSGALERLLSHAVSLWYGRGVPPPEVRFDRATTLLDHQAQTDTYIKAAQAITALNAAGLSVDLAELAKRYEIPILTTPLTPGGSV
jgi:phage gp29-like protein